MNQAQEYARLNSQLEWVKTRIKKVQCIIDIPNQLHIKSDEIKVLREKMLDTLTTRRDQLERQINDLVDDVSLEDSNICEFIYGYSP